MIQVGATPDIKAASGGLPEIALAKMVPPLRQQAQGGAGATARSPAGVRDTAADPAESASRLWKDYPRGRLVRSTAALRIDRRLAQRGRGRQRAERLRLSHHQDHPARSARPCTISHRSADRDETDHTEEMSFRRRSMPSPRATTKSISSSTTTMRSRTAGRTSLTAFLLRYAPSNFHLVIMSRTEPSFAHFKASAHGRTRRD